MTSERFLNAQSRPRILIVDDDLAICRLLRAVLQRDYTLEEVSTGDKALDILDQAVAPTNGGGFLAMAALVARFHHERYDGTGCPAALVGQEIPLPARIVALADVYDAITSERPYKPAYSPVCARELIRLACGTHFDPLVVAAFDASFPAFLTIQPTAYCSVNRDEMGPVETSSETSGTAPAG